MHKLDDDTLITPTLLRRFHAEAEFEGGEGNFYAFIQRSNRDLLVHNVGPEIGGPERLFAGDLLTFLNNELHHDGAWCIVFTHPRIVTAGFAIPEWTFERFTILWMDKDGDVQFPLVHELGVTTALGWGLIQWAVQCETAWSLWHHAMRVVLDPQPNEMFARAKGQPRPSVH